MSEIPRNTLLSIIVPVYNRANLLPELLDSIYEQSYRPIEVILVDDGSKDDPATILAAWLEKTRPDNSLDCRLVHQSNQGAPAARNRGWAEAKGCFLQFIDSDDVLVPGGITPLLNQLCKYPYLDFAYGIVESVRKSDDNWEVESKIGSPFQSSGAGIIAYDWHTMGPVYRTQSLSRVGPWNTSLTGSQDWEFLARVKLAGLRGELVPTVVGHFRQHDGTRVGTRRFRSDYVQSAGMACASIWLHATKHEKQTKIMQKKLGNRILVHILEAKAHSDFKSCQFLLQQFRMIQANTRKAKVLCILPTIFASFLFHQYVKMRLR